MSIATSTAASTVNCVALAVPETGSVAVIVVLPTAAVVARPRLPAALLIVAAVSFAEVQVTTSVRSCVVLSLNVPMAVNGCV